MVQGVKHIAISILLIFLLPIVYQPVHIMGHHSYKHNNNTVNKQEKELNSPDFQQNEHCYICEYEFTVTDLPHDLNIPFIEFFLNELNPVKVQDIFPIDVILHTSPRAPPFFT